MKKLLILTLITMSVNGVVAQNVMSPELLWKLGRISPLGISKDEKNIIYKVSTPSVEENNSNSKYYSVPVNGGNAVENSDYKSLLADKNVSPDGKYTVYNEEVKIDKVHGKDFYPNLDKSNAQIYDATEIALISRLTYIMVSSSILLQTQVDAFYQLGINTIKGFYNWLNGLPGPTKEAAIIVFNNFMSNPYWGLPLAGPSNLAGCQLVVYKPNNYQYAKQGAVDSSTRNLKLNVDTISTNAASIQNYNNTGPLLISANEIYAGNNPNVMNLLKNKAPQNNTPQCNFQIPLNFRPVFQNKNSCRFTGLN